MTAPDVFDYYVCDLLSGEILDELPFSSFHWTRAKNTPGGWSATISHRQKKLQQTPTLLDPWRRSVFAVREGQVFAGGMLTSRKSSTDSPMSVGGAGFLDYYRKGRRRITSRSGMTYATGQNTFEITFTNVDQLRIAVDLVSHAEAVAGAAGVNWDFVRMNGPITGGLSGVNRTRTYWTYENKSLGDAIDDLAKVDSGFDYAESYYIDGDRIGRVLDFYYPYKGIELGLSFEVGRNVILLNHDSNGEDMATRFIATGAGQADALLSSTAINASAEYPAGPYPMIEASESFNDLSTQSLLNAQSARSLSERKVPIESLELKVKEDVDVSLGSFDWGDRAQCFVDDGALQVNGLFRVEQFTVDIDQNGKYDIKPTLAMFDTSIGIA